MKLQKLKQKDYIISAISCYLIVIILKLVIYNGNFIQNPAFYDKIIDKDFANYWMAGRLILAGKTGDLFSSHVDYFRHMIEVFGPDYQIHNWSYPPSYLFFIWWTGYFNYIVALILFLAITWIFFLYATQAFIGQINLIVIAMMMTFWIENTWSVQNGFITAGLALGALALRAEKPILAGILLGLLTVKPQLGFLFPFFLIAERRWMVIVSASVTTLLLVLLSILVLGVDSWIGYFSNVIPYQTIVMTHLNGLFVSGLTSLFGSMRALGFDYHSAIIVHAVFCVPILILTIVAFFTVKDDQDRSILLVLGTFLITPYALTYDLGMLSAAAALMALRCIETQNLKDPILYLAIAVAVLPTSLVNLSSNGLPIMPLVLSVLYAFIYIRSGGYTGLKQFFVKNQEGS